MSAKGLQNNRFCEKARDFLPMTLSENQFPGLCASVNEEANGQDEIPTPA
jgi:hypothetical protein